MKAVILHKATIVTSSIEAIGSVIVTGGTIADVIYCEGPDFESKVTESASGYDDVEYIHLEGRHLMAGGIDAHVHFRDPGLTHKADIHTESKAALCGGVTSVFDMPNTQPPTVSAEALSKKIESVQKRSYTNIGFHIGATNGNHEEIREILNGERDIESEAVGGVKVFMGSSTGNMLVDDNESLDNLFAIKSRPVLVHCEDEATIRENLDHALEKYGEEIPFSEHENIRSRKACIKSSIKALEKAIEHQTSLVLCHISTKEEMEMVRAAKYNNPNIIAETSCNYLWFCNNDYNRLGSLVKCNPSIKTADDRMALRQALADGTIDTIGSDHAPHLLSEKSSIYTKAPSGLPTIQQSLPVLLTIAVQEGIPLSRIASVFSENASDLYGLNRGKIAKGYAADIVIFDLSEEFVVNNDDQHGKCGWTPYAGEKLKGVINMVFVNGNVSFDNGKFTEECHGSVLKFTERKK